MKHLIEEQLILYYYGESEEGPAVEEHLGSCDSCRSDLEELKRVLAAVDTFSPPERSAEYGSEVWTRLRPRLRGRHGIRWPALASPRRLAWAGLMAALVVAAFLTGRLWQPQQVPVAEHKAPEQISPAHIRERVLLASIVDHLERSRMFLLDLSHAGAARNVDISADRAWARELLAENRIYRLSAQKSGDVGVASVLDDLERILVEIANGPEHASAKELEEFRQRIDAQGVIFKLGIIGSSIRQKEAIAARELARRTS